MPRIAVLLLASVLGLAAGEADPRAQARSLWTEAAQSGGVWTCLQLEAWGQAQQPPLRLGPVLGASVVHGDARFAFPDDVRLVADLGDRILAATDRMLLALAPDGRPLERPLMLAPAGRPALGFAGQAVAVAATRWDGAARPPTTSLIAAVYAIADRQRRFEAVRTLAAGEYWEGQLVVADDGSAIAAGIGAPRGPQQPPARSVWLAVAAGGSDLTGCTHPLAVGRSGSWLVAHGPGGTVLVRGRSSDPITQPAVGPGLLACVRGGQPTLVGIDGSDRPLSGAPAGGQPRLHAVGGWLALDTGLPAATLTASDLLGETTPAPSGGIMLWRWADLAADPGAAPAATLAGRAEVAEQFPAALWNWQPGVAGVDLVDLTQPQPAIARYVDTPAAVVRAATSGGALVVELAERQRVVYGPGREVAWEGRCDHLSLRRPDLALVGRQEGREMSWQLAWLAADPQARRSVNVAVPPRYGDIRVGFPDLDWMVVRGADGWIQFSLAVPEAEVASGGMAGGTSGRTPLGLAVLDRGGAARQPPACPVWDLPPGRFYPAGARLLAKAKPLPPPAERLDVRDAWRDGPAAVALGAFGQVLVGRKRGEWEICGVVADADRLVLAKGGGLAAGDPRGKPLTVIAAAAAPAQLGAAPPGPGTELPEGPWRAKANARFQPQGRELAWEGDRLGFWPARLRSPEGHPALLACCRGLLIELAADAARTVAK